MYIKLFKKIIQKIYFKNLKNLKKIIKKIYLKNSKNIFKKFKKFIQIMYTKKILHIFPKMSTTKTNGQLRYPWTFHILFYIFVRDSGRLSIIKF
jgi:hypothetical protein